MEVYQNISSEIIQNSSLIKINYNRMVTGSATTIPGQMLQEQYSNIYQKNMDSKSFVGKENIIKSILSEPNTASFETQIAISYRHEYITCQV